MPTIEEKFLMKEQMKELRHKVRLEEERRKREMAEIKYMNAKRRSETLKSISGFLFTMIPVFIVLGFIGFFVYMFVSHS